MTKAPKKMSPAARRIMRGLNEASAWARGEPVKVRIHNVAVPKINLKNVRKKLGLSQAGFSTRFGIPPATLRNWEQGRREPELSTRILLAIIDKHPGIVDEVLGGKG